MAGRTVAEKILSRAAGLPDAKAGEVVEARPDLVMSHENTFLVNKAFTEMGGTRPWAPDRMVVVLDHRGPANTVDTAVVHSKIRQLVKDYGIERLYDVGEGVCHQLLVEKKLAKPGQLVLGSDSHTTTAGAVGAFGAGIGATEMAGIWATGSLWMRVPATIQVRIEGHLNPGCFVKDIALQLAADFGPSGADYSCVEFTGMHLLDTSLAGRMVLCNMAAEMGAKAAIVPADSIALVYYAGCIPPGCGPVRSDQDASFSRKIELEVSKIPPLVSGPDKIERASSVEKLRGTRIDQAFIGTCTNGRLEDLVAVSWVVKGKKVAPWCRLLVAPASREVMEDAMSMGVIQTILSAGGTILPPGCGPCLGAHGGVLAPGEVCISSGNRNFKGRMGSDQAEVYIASPATVAASAITGEISDPREVLTFEL